MASSDPARLAFWCLGAFLAGSIPFGLLLVKVAGKGDVRRHGSGNIGATNVSRVGGKALGVLTLLLDILKGGLSVWLARRAGLDYNFVALVGFLAVAGHVFTPWLKFQGGKGVATALGAAFALDPVWILPSLGLFAVLLALFRFVSLGSVAGAALMPLVLVFRKPPGPVWPGLLLWAATFFLVIAKHHENIRRLLKGEESPLWGRKEARG
ncbi:MAG: glycerol-3-phosphate 1-O-acyltransferase PlsY [Acidobacteria bacterium]|nr:glycerol-3-phosphate 1-O-acyltransferase PlsY [Acidobacteriota bacterium]